MGLLDAFRKKAPQQGNSGNPYMIKTSFTPFKLKANTRSSSTFSVTVRNVSNEEVMSSVTVEVPQRLSIDDQTGLTKQKDIKFGPLGAGEEKSASINIYSGPGTDKGEYTINLTAYVNYRDYSHVINSVTKKQVLEAI